MRIHILVKGRVQGVSFRAYTRMEAKKLQLSGYAKNLIDGRVEIIAEGEKEILEKLLLWSHKGSPYSKVDEVVEEYSEETGEFKEFEIRY